MGKLRLIKSRGKEPGTEKITINLGCFDLGQVDLLIMEEFYSIRTDFICTTIRNHRGSVLKRTVARRAMVLGLQRHTRRHLESVRAAGDQLHKEVLGQVTIDDNVPAQVAAQTFAAMVILDLMHASAKVKAALAGRIHCLSIYPCEGT